MRRLESKHRAVCLLGGLGGLLVMGLGECGWRDDGFEELVSFVVCCYVVEMLVDCGIASSWFARSRLTVSLGIVSSHIA